MDPMSFDPALDDETFEDLPEILEPSQEEKDLEYATQLAAGWRENRDNLWICLFFCSLWRDLPLLHLPLPLGLLFGIWMVVPLRVHWPLLRRLRFAGWRLAWPLVSAAFGLWVHLLP